MAATDAHPVAIRGSILRITFPILDADGDLVSGASSLDSEFSEDGATFADCSGESTEIATSSGMYFLDLIATETDGDTVAVIVKSNEGKTTPMVIYPASAGNPVNVNVEQISDDATAADNLELDYDGTGLTRANSTIGTATVATTAVNVTNVSSGAIVSASFAAGAINAAATADDFVDEIWNEAMSGHVTVGTFGQAMGGLAARTGTVSDAGAAATDFDVAGFTEATDDHLNGMVMTFTDGVLTGQSRVITDYIGSGQNCLFAEAWTETPGNGDGFVITNGALMGGTLAVVQRLFLTILNASTGQLDAGSLSADTLNANALAVDAVAEIWSQAMTETTGAPAVTASVLEAMKWIFALSRNKITQTSSTSTLRNDADNSDLATSAVSDDATTAIRGEWST